MGRTIRWRRTTSATGASRTAAWCLSSSPDVTRRGSQRRRTAAVGAFSVAAHVCALALLLTLQGTPPKVEEPAPMVVQLAEAPQADPVAAPTPDPPPPAKPPPPRSIARQVRAAAGRAAAAVRQTLPERRRRRRGERRPGGLRGHRRFRRRRALRHGPPAAGGVAAQFAGAGRRR